MVCIQIVAVRKATRFSFAPEVCLPIEGESHSVVIYGLSAVLFELPNGVSLLPRSRAAQPRRVAACEAFRLLVSSDLSLPVLYVDGSGEKSWRKVQIVETAH